jgi:hypothetical protein
MAKQTHEQVFLISAQNDTTEDFEATVHRLQRAGARVVAQMPLVGIVRCVADPAKKKELERVDGVKRVDPEGEMYLAGAAGKH